MENGTIEILLIEDDLAEAGMIGRMLAEPRQPGYSVQHVRNLADGLRQLATRAFDVILAVLALPDSNGLETAQSLRNQAKMTPIVAMISPDDEEAVLKATQSDFQDYLIKGRITGDVLKRSIRYAIQRKRDMEACQRCEQWFASFMLHLPVAAWVKDLQGRYVYANEGDERIFSMPFSEYSGKRDEEFLPPETASQLRRNDEQVLAEGESLQMVEFLRQADGIEHHYIVNKFPIPGPNGQPAYVAGIALDITERAMAEEALRKSERKFAKIFHGVPALVGISTLEEGRFFDVNDTTLHTLGYRREEMIGRSALELNLWEDLADRAAMLRALEEKGSVKNLEVRLRGKSGQRLVGLLSAEYIELNGDRYLLSLIRDITDRKRMEEALQKSEKKFAKVFHEAPALLCISTLEEGRFIDVNDTMLYTLGFRREEMIGRTAQELNIWEDMSERDAILQALEEKGAAKNIETRFRGKSGQRFVGLFSAEYIDLDGDRYMLSLVKDITLKKQAQEEVERLNTELMDANKALAEDLEAMKALQKIGMLFLHKESLEQILSQVLEAAIAISGADFGNIQIMNPKTFCLQIAVHHGFPQWWLDFWNRVVEGKGVCGTALGRGERVIVEDIEHSPIFVGTEALEIQLKAGVRAVQSTPLVSRSGSLLGMFSTHYKAPHRPTDRELRLLDLLSRHAADFIEQAHLREMLQTRAAELEEANQELDAFNYTVAHDLRKPLTAINGYCQIVQEVCGNNLDDQCKKYLQEAYDGTWRMNQLIDTLLNFSRATCKEPMRETVDLSGIAREVANGLKQAEPERRGTFRIAEGISVTGDPNLLRVVLENLLGNAWKYVGIREEALIEFGTAEIDGRPACFVRDNGPGFAPEDADKLFIPFQRLPGAEEHKGFGIGLATVDRIIRRHDGRVWAEGEPGKGATFYFMLGAMTA